MTVEEIREVVKITIDELSSRKLLKSDDYTTMLRAVEVSLYRYFDNKDNSIGKILNKLYDDPYIDIIFLSYRDNKTLEFIADYLERDISTVKRNKRRLITTIYKMLQE